MPVELPPTVAVIDIGKTHAKVVLIDRVTGEEIDATTTSYATRQEGPYPHPDVAMLADFVCGGLSDLHRSHGFAAISITAHGAAGAFLAEAPTDGGDGLALPVLDYEHDGPDELADEYDALRPTFDETLSPRLPGGLNLGAQIFWQTRRFPAEVAGARTYVTYPQYWAWRLTGVAATEMCSIGCHTDLWNPTTARWSSLVGKLHWDGLFAPVRSAFGEIGVVDAGLGRRLGLSANMPVACGIHDSSASLLPYLIARPAPFTVASTGTWTVLMAVGGTLEGLDSTRDTLAYVTPYGTPVPSARFMGGREFERLAGVDAPVPTPADIARVLDEGIMALPTFASGVGPYPDDEGRWSHPPEGLEAGEKTAVASLYLALVTAESMTLAGADGPTIVEGPFAANALYCSALAAITGRAVLPSAGTSGPGRGAALLFQPRQGYPQADMRPVVRLSAPAFEAYVRRWKTASAA